jgi:hypothetical protein
VLTSTGEGAASCRIWTIVEADEGQISTSANIAPSLSTNPTALTTWDIPAASSRWHNSSVKSPRS